MIVTITIYRALTKNAFSLTETVAIASLITQGVSPEDIRYQVLESNLLQLRSYSSREGALQTILRRFKDVPKDYIFLLVSDNLDIRRFTLFFLVLQENRLLRELVTAVLREKLNRLEKMVKLSELKVFFEAKREQEPAITKWSTSTYRKTVQNTIMALVKAGFLYLMPSRKDYEIRAIPIPFQLRQQLIVDGYESYLVLMLD
jgi:hypothetical protein